VIAKLFATFSLACNL